VSVPAQALLRVVSAAVLLAALVGASAWMQALAWGVGDDTEQTEGEATADRR